MKHHIKNIFLSFILLTSGVVQAQPTVTANASIFWGWDSLNWNVPDSFIKQMIDHFKESGYRGIEFNVRVRVASDGTVTDRTPSPRMWDYVKYATSIGLKSDIKVTWTDDENETLNFNLPSSFNTDVFINGAGEYLLRTASYANKNGATTIYIGTESDPLFTSKYKTNWVKVISDLRSNFKGKIYYNAWYFGIKGWDARQVDIWDIVDAITLSFYPHLASGQIDDVSKIESLYLSADPSLSSGNTFPTTKKCVWDTQVPNIVEDLKGLSAKYGKPVTFGEVNFQPVSANLCGFVMSPEFVSVNAPIDSAAQSRAYVALFEILNNNLNGTVTEINIWGYDPWLYFRNDNWAASKPYDEIWGSPAEATIGKYLKQWYPNQPSSGTTVTPTGSLPDNTNIQILPVYPGPNTTVSVTLKGAAGSVRTSIDGIDCGSLCSYQFTKGTTIHLTATPASGHKLKNWGGACGGNKPTCRLKLNSFNKKVTATFK